MTEKEVSKNNMAKKEKKKNSLLKNLSKNYWAISTVVLALALIATLIIPHGNVSGAVIGADLAGQKVVKFLSNQGVNAEVIEINDNGQLYEVVLSANGQGGSLYITKDGKTLVPQLVPLEEVEEQTETATATTNTQPEQPASYSEEDLTKLKEFNDCLGEKGLKIYGANWCGWTKKLAVETLGGFETASATYVECTEEKELCQSEGIQGYPTIKLNSETYSGARTLEALSQATGCQVPELIGTPSTSSDEGAC